MRLTRPAKAQFRPSDALTPPVTAHGCCRGVPGTKGCSKRTWLTLPGRMCDRCIEKVVARTLAALDKMEAAEDGE